MSRVISDSVCELVGHRGGLSVLERKSDELDSLLVPEGGDNTSKGLSGYYVIIC